MTTLNVNVPRVAEEPRGAHVLGRWGAAFFEGLRHLTAARAETDAARVRALAHAYDDIDPRLAADLYAAADHDEAVHGV